MFESPVTSQSIRGGSCPRCHFYGAQKCASVKGLTIPITKKICNRLCKKDIDIHVRAMACPPWSVNLKMMSVTFHFCQVETSQLSTKQTWTQNIELWETRNSKHIEDLFFSKQKGHIPHIITQYIKCISYSLLYVHYDIMNA